VLLCWSKVLVFLGVNGLVFRSVRLRWLRLSLSHGCGSILLRQGVVYAAQRAVLPTAESPKGRKVCRSWIGAAVDRHSSSAVSWPWRLLKPTTASTALRVSGREHGVTAHGARVATNRQVQHAQSSDIDQSVARRSGRPRRRRLVGRDTWNRNQVRSASLFGAHGSRPVIPPRFGNYYWESTAVINCWTWRNELPQSRSQGRAVFALVSLLHFVVCACSGPSGLQFQ